LTTTTSGTLAINNLIQSSTGTAIPLVVLVAAGALSQDATTGAVASTRLIASTTLDAGAPITLNNPSNAITGDVTLSALNTAGATRATGTLGTITFFDGTGFNIASQLAPQLGVVTSDGAGTTATLQAAGAITESDGAIVAPVLVARTLVN